MGLLFIPGACVNLHRKARRKARKVTGASDVIAIGITGRIMMPWGKAKAGRRPHVRYRIVFGSYNQVMCHEPGGSSWAW